MGFGNKEQHHHIIDYESDMYTGITTFHGLVRIYNANHWWSRLFWIALAFIAMLLFFLQVRSTLMIYTNRPTMIQEVFSDPEDGIEFPDMTICNFNPTKMSEIAKWNMSNNTIRYVLLAYLQVENLYSNYNRSQIEALHSEYQTYIDRYLSSTGKNFSLRHFFNSTGYRCEEMIKRCIYAGIMVENCCDHAEEIMTDMGKCFKFRNFGNHSWTNRQRISGAFYGLQMNILIHQNEYPPLFDEDYMNTGIKYFLHPEGIVPFLSSMGSAVPPGHKGFGAVTVKNYSLLPMNDWGECQTEWKLAENHSNFVKDQVYSSSNCEANCIANKFMNECNCVPLRYQIDEIMPVCTPHDLYHCINITEMYALLVETDEYWYNRNICKCGIECNRTTYNIEMSYGGLPKAVIQDFRARYGKENLHAQDDLILLNVFMKEMLYEKFVQVKSISRTAVLSDIGGNMGMFLGMSVITLGEIFVFFIKAIWGCCHRDRRDDISKRESSDAVESIENDASAPSSIAYRTTYNKLFENSPARRKHSSLRWAKSPFNSSKKVRRIASLKHT